MDPFSGLRSGSEQLRDDLLASWERMTDPEEIEKQRIKKRREGCARDVQQDAGL